ncbi:type II secretion system minor pseudopilin GspH [Shewanella gelidimarina]|uniref:type II secretion system minor pseudopilin GspH n=1 Tax=Shewanella gelidimarina TaxID=56813 RepID=UPI00200EB4ED|nr:type II secretion system minor pseudopilin GspH [Shewanella gelidimarina]MCL1059439.1 type II secretion system minor pseudopilin GspH [Shewanella gelidimarina]
MISVTGTCRTYNKMTLSRIVRARQAGFTLMEVLLVVLLMGLAASAVTLSMGGASQEKALERLAVQFMMSAEMVLDETVLSGQFIGIVVEKDSYEYVYYDYDDGKWKPLEQDRLLSARQMEPGFELHLVLDGLPLVQEDEEQDSWFDEPLIEPSADDKKKYPEPQILLFPSGEMSAFELSFVTRNEMNKEIEVVVFGDVLGRLKLDHEDDI